MSLTIKRKVAPPNKVYFDDTGGWNYYELRLVVEEQLAKAYRGGERKYVAERLRWFADEIERGEGPLVPNQ